MELALLRRNTAKARAILFHLLMDWQGFPGERPSANDQKLLLHNGLLAQQTVYAAFRECGALVAGELVRQQAFVDYHVDACGTEQEQREYAAHRSRRSSASWP
jgi:hypothetical protein